MENVEESCIKALIRGDKRYGLSEGQEDFSEKVGFIDVVWDGWT